MACGKTRVPIPLGIDDQRLWEGLDMVSQGICITKPFREPLLRPVRRLLRRYSALIAPLLSFGVLASNSRSSREQGELVNRQGRS